MSWMHTWKEPPRPGMLRTHLEVSALIWKPFLQMNHLCLLAHLDLKVNEYLDQTQGHEFLFSSHLSLSPWVFLQQKSQTMISTNLKILKTRWKLRDFLIHSLPLVPTALNPSDMWFFGQVWKISIDTKCIFYMLPVLSYFWSEALLNLVNCLFDSLHLLTLKFHESRTFLSHHGASST